MLRPALRAATYRTLLGMLAVTGMRVGELIALDRDDVDLGQGQLAIREAKHATRQLPLHPSTVRARHAYADRRDQICRTPKAPSFFISTAGTRLIYECVRETFITLRRVAGLEHETDPGPRIHDYADLWVMPTWSRYPAHRLEFAAIRSA
jgi:integrase/recombinase XerD